MAMKAGQVAAPEVTAGITEPLTPEEQAAIDAEGASGETPPEPAPPQPDPNAPPAPGPTPAPQARHPEAIPYQRFQEVNAERNQARQEAAELREKWARLEERQRLAQEAEQRMRQAQTQAQRPDPTVDPWGAEVFDLKAHLAQQAQVIEELRTGQGQTQQQLQQREASDEMVNWIRSDVSNYEREHNDYPKAAAHAFGVVRNFFADLGANPQEQEQALGALQTMAIHTARRYGTSPAAAFDKLARGLAPYAAAAPNPAPGPAPAPAPNRAQTVLQQAQKGQAHQGLSRVPAARDENLDWTTMGAKELAEMPDDEFTAGMNDPQRRAQLLKAFERIELGGGA